MSLTPISGLIIPIVDFIYYCFNVEIAISIFLRYYLTALLFM